MVAARVKLEKGGENSSRPNDSKGTGNCGGGRLVVELGEEVWFGSYVREERQVIVFGQDERLRDIERAMQMKHQRIGRRWFVTGVLFENGFHVLQNVLPAADLAPCVFQFPFESANHEVIVIGRDDN